MSIIQNYISSLAGQALTPTVDTPITPTPFDDEKRKDIGFGKFGISRGSADSSVVSSPPNFTDGEDPDNYPGSGKFSGTSGNNTLTVDQILTEDGTIKPEQGYFDSLSGKYYIDPVTGQLKKGFPTGLGTFLPAPIGFLAGAGLAISNKVLSGISDKVKEGKEGYGIASVNGKTVGVSKGLFGGYVLTGNIPDNITAKQRQNLIDQILNTKAPAPKPKETLPSAVKTPSPDDNNDPVFDDDGYSGVGPSPDDGGSMGDPGYYPSNVSPSLYTGRPDDSPSTPDEPGGEEPDYGGGMQDDYDSGIDGPGGAKGGRVGLKGGGAAGKAPSTGFIDGPPQNYSKGMTVADTEDMKVRVGSFIINAPTTERLQKEGKLPKGPQKRKAAKGGKMMDVALSKGEYLIDVADIEKFGGYDALNAENDKGKAEVDRRQAAASGGFINGYKYGGTPFTGPQQEPDLTIQDVRQVPQQNNSKGFVFKPLNAAELRESDYNQLSEDLLSVLEGDGSKAYFPGNKRSGITVGKGFDIGQHSVKDMQKMGFSKELINKFKPFIELKGDAAKNKLKEKGLILLPEEVKEVDKIVLPYKREKFLKDYPQYSELNPSDKSVMFSAHYVGGLGRYESFQKVFNKTKDMEKALKTGLIKILPKGAAERNRAEKALKWWKSRQGPKITLDSSATR